TWLEPLKNGRNKRHFETLKLERSSVFLFPLNWTVVHPIDSDSPLYKKNREELEQMKIEFIIMLRGYDESFNQLIHANKSFICDEIRWGFRFKPMYFEDENGTTLEIDKINDVEKIDL
ncbi:MAG: transporter, partial [Bacteroidota bacterium]